MTAPAPQQATSAAELRADIERTRLALGDTVEALAGKTDVKARAKGKAVEVRQKVTAKFNSARESGSDGGGPSGASAAMEQARAKAQANPVPTAAAAALLGGFLIGRITKRR